MTGLIRRKNYIRTSTRMHPEEDGKICGSLFILYLPYVEMERKWCFDRTRSEVRFFESGVIGGRGAAAAEFRHAGRRRPLGER